MSMDIVTICIGSRTHRLPLDSFLHIMEGGVSLDCRAAYMKQRLSDAGSAGPHRRQRYWFGIGQDRRTYDSLADVLVAAMRWVHDNDPEAHSQLANRRKATRAYIAGEPADLYAPSRRHLAVFARRYADGWYLDTNLSYPGACRFLDDCFSLTALVKGRDWFFRRLW